MLKKFRFTYLVVAFFMALSLLAGCSGGGGGGGGVAAPTFETVLGDVRCVDEGDMIACRGIPYAAPPVGDLRFARPQAHATWTGVRNATAFGSACVQDNGTGSENCLFLNVFMPAGTEPDADLPVMVWIHGGALIQGASSVPGYDVPALVNEGIVVVTINYRLNAFGFLPHPALEDTTGNFGLKDQVFALQWVQDTINSFGGDPGNVTIFGESAGGHSVLSLLVAPSAAGLFHKAIVQSGSYSPTQTALSTGYYTLGAPFADLPAAYPVVPDSPFLPRGVGPCSSESADPATWAAEIRACLRNLTVAEVMAAQNAGPAWAWFTPVYAAETLLPKSISAALTAGEVANVPVMIGSNLNEGSLFTALFMSGYGNFAALDNLVAGVTTLLVADPRSYDRSAVASDYAGWAAATYGANDNRWRNAHSMIFTDATFSCNALGHAATLAALHPTSTYSYWFTDADAPIHDTYAALGALSAFFNLGNWGFGASHSFEIQYIFGTVQDHSNVTPNQVTLSNRMITYWTNFAKDGAPGGGWTAYNGTNIRELNPAGDSDATATAFATAHYCACWGSPGLCWPVEPL